MRLRKTMTIRKPLVVVSIAAAVAALSACTYTPTADNNYHGTVSGNGAPPSTVSTPAVPAVPVTITGSGEQVETADLVAAGYTVTYQASSWTLIVQPVQADGSDGPSLINAIGHDSSSGVTGTTTYRATGRTTFHVSNTQGSWSLTFNPLS
jgi:hypothetical protein